MNNRDEFDDLRVSKTFLFVDDALVHVTNLLQEMIDFGNVSSQNKKVLQVASMHLMACRAETSWIEDSYDFTYDPEEENDETYSN